MSEKPESDGIPEFKWPFRNPPDIVAELFCACRWQIGDSEAADFAAQYLLAELNLRFGEEKAKSAFLRAIKEESGVRDEMANIALLTRYYLWEDKRTGKRNPNVEQLVQQIAAENAAFNKSPKRNGAPQRQTSQSALKKQIRRLRDGESGGGIGLSDMFAKFRPKKKMSLKTVTAKKRHVPKRKIELR